MSNNIFQVTASVQFDHNSRIRILPSDESNITIALAYSRLASAYDRRPRTADSSGGVPEEDFPA